MKAKWLLGATLALFGAGAVATAQDSHDQKQPPPPPGQNDNQNPPTSDARTPPAPTSDNSRTPPPAPTSDGQHSSTATTSIGGSQPPPPGNVHTSGQANLNTQTSGQVGASGHLNTQGGQFQTQTDHANMQSTGQVHTGQQTQFDQRGVAVEGQVQTGQWQGGQTQPGYNQNGWVQGGQYQQPGMYQGRWVQGQYQPGYNQGGWSQNTQVQGWAQPGYNQGGWVQGQYQPGYNQGQYQPGYVQGQAQQGFVQGGQMPMDQSAQMSGPQNFHRAKQVIGTRVSIEGGVSIGVVEDIVFSDNGNIEFLVVANEGKLVSVPWTAAHFNFEQRMATVAINQEQFQQIPTFTASAWPTFDPQYRTQVYGFFGNRAGYVTPGMDRRMDRQMDRGFNRGRR